MLMGAANGLAPDDAFFQNPLEVANIVVCRVSVFPQNHAEFVQVGSAVRPMRFENHCGDALSNPVPLHPAPAVHKRPERPRPSRLFNFSLGGDKKL